MYSTAVTIAGFLPLERLNYFNESVVRHLINLFTDSPLHPLANVARSRLFISGQVWVSPLSPLIPTIRAKTSLVRNDSYATK